MQCLSTLVCDSTTASSTSDCQSPTTTFTACRASSSTFLSLQAITLNFQIYLTTLCTTLLAVHFAPTEALEIFNLSQLVNLSWGGVLRLSSGLVSYCSQSCLLKLVAVDMIFGLGSRRAVMDHIYDQFSVLSNFLALGSFHHGSYSHRLKVFLPYLCEKKWRLVEYFAAGRKQVRIFELFLALNEW